jgi:hypothetical protein
LQDKIFVQTVRTVFHRTLHRRPEHRL